ncbi:MAG: MFS transporter [Chlorobi bacterium]|nr:MFS transporter [Chlorobiota bacterium]
MKSKSTIYTSAFYLAFAYNFFQSLNFSNNAIYPLYVTYSGGGAEMVGLFMSAFSIAAVLGRPLVGLMIDRFRIKPVLLAGSLMMALPSIGYYFLIGEGLVPLVWILRIIQGFGFGAHFTGFFTLAAQNAPIERRNEAVATYGVSGLMGALIGPYLGENLVEHFGLPVFFLVMCGLSLVGFLFILPLSEKGEGGTHFPGLRTLLSGFRSRKLLFVLFLAMCLAFSYSTPQVFLAPIAKERGIWGFGLYFTGFGVTGIFIRMLGRKWGDRIGLRRILIPAFISYGLGLLILEFSSGIEGIILAGAVNGFAHGIAFPAVTALGYNQSRPEIVGSSMALVTGVMDASNAINAIVLGQAAGYFGYGVVFWLAALAPLAAAAVLVVNVLVHPVVIRSPHN